MKLHLSPLAIVPKPSRHRLANYRLASCLLAVFLFLATSLPTTGKADILLNFDDGTSTPTLSDPNLSLSITPGGSATVTGNPANDTDSLSADADAVGVGPALDAAGDFHSITLTVRNLAVNQTLDIDEFNFGWGANNPLNFSMAVFSDVTGFGAGLELGSHVFGSTDLDPSDNIIVTDVTDSGFSGLQNGDTVELRIYFQDTSNSSGREHMLDDITITTTVNGDAPVVVNAAGMAELLGVFTDSTVASAGGFTFTTTTETDLSGSTWGVGVNEEDVYHAALRHEQAGHDWQVRIGRGGQIYSIIDSVLGELVPPQRSHSPYVDEVFQVVSAESGIRDIYGPDADIVFYHQSGYFAFGIRGDDPTNPQNLQSPTYAPLLADGAVENDSFSTMTLSVQANPTKFPQIPSKLIHYQRTRSLGDGVIEVTNSIYNFGDLSVGFHNMPWGGVRRSKLDYMLVSDLGGGFSNAIVDDFGNTADQLVSILNTGGWAAWAEEDATLVDPSSVRAMGYVFGNTQPHINEPWQNRAGQWRWGRGGDDVRDFNVCTFRQGIEVGPGDFFENRYFMVLGDVDHIESTINSRALVDAATYDMIRVSEQDSATLGFNIETSSGITTVQQASASESCDFKTYAQPVQGSLPLFMFRDSSGNQCLSVDPYALSGFPYDGETTYEGILGFVLPADIAQGDGPYVDLDTLFPAGYYKNTDPATTVFALGPDFLLADVNRDGAVNFFDIAPFIALLSSGEFQAEADVNQDGFVDFLDIAPFIGELTNS